MKKTVGDCLNIQWLLHIGGKSITDLLKIVSMKKTVGDCLNIQWLLHIAWKSITDCLKIQSQRVWKHNVSKSMHRLFENTVIVDQIFIVGV